MDVATAAVPRIKKHFLFLKMDRENTHIHEGRSVVMKPDVCICLQRYSGGFCSSSQHFCGFEEVFLVENSKKYKRQQTEVKLKRNVRKL